MYAQNDTRQIDKSELLIKNNWYMTNGVMNKEMERYSVLYTRVK